MNIDFNIFDFVDILYIVLFPIAIMAWMTLWLQRQRRSRTLILSVWCGFVVVVFVGLVSLLFNIQSVRVLWLNYFAEVAAAYSVVVSNLNHWNIVAGDENVFSEWSMAVGVIAFCPEGAQDLALGCVGVAATATLTPLQVGNRLSIPENFTATRISPTQVALRWDAVPGATAYRVKWGNPYWDDEDWEVDDSTSALERIVEIDDDALVFRIRAETGTPQDDPLYLTLMAACVAAETNSQFIASVYTMRPVPGEKDYGMFIICPAVVEDGIIIHRAAPIGERYPNSPIMYHVFSTHKAAINSIPVVDEWGTWISAFHPLFDPDGNFDGIVGFDIDYDLWGTKLTEAKIWPYSFFTILMLLFFASIYLIVLNKLSLEEARNVAGQLQDTVDQLTEAKAVAESAVRTKGHFLANMSHEIRTPMNAVLGFANIIGRKLMERCLPEEQEQCREAVDLIASSGNDLLTIINDILDFSRVDSDTVEIETIPVSIRETIESVRSIMQERLVGKENLTLEFIDEGGIPGIILSDPTRLRQILNNLIGNAIKFTESGIVSVGYGVETTSSRTNERRLFIKVRDTGIGMSSEQLKRLFVPFSQADSSLTRRFGGTGLGLSIAKRLAVLLGGDIQVTSQEGKGSVFTFFHPIREPSAKAIQEWNTKRQKYGGYYRIMADSGIITPSLTKSPKVKPLSDFNVLVVEDARVNQIVFSTQLTDAGAKVTIADNGSVAIESIKSAKLPFDVVLMDMQMPVMDGYETTRRLRNSGYTQPIIAVTAHALSGDCEKTLDAGCNAYLSKPVNGEQLTRTILEVCRGEE